MKLNHHSADFRRRFKQLVRDEKTRLTTTDDLVAVEERLDKESLAKLHDNIRFTQTVMKEQAEERWKE